MKSVKVVLRVSAVAADQALIKLIRCVCVAAIISVICQILST